MAALSRVKPGQILYQVQRVKCGNTTISRGCLYEVEIISIDEDAKTLVVSWNGNRPQRKSVSYLKNLKVNKPKPKGQVLGMDSY